MIWNLFGKDYTECWKKKDLLRLSESTPPENWVCIWMLQRLRPYILYICTTYTNAKTYKSTKYVGPEFSKLGTVHSPVRGEPVYIQKKTALSRSLYTRARARRKSDLSMYRVEEGIFFFFFFLYLHELTTYTYICFLSQEWWLLGSNVTRHVTKYSWRDIHCNT